MHKSFMFWLWSWPSLSPTTDDAKLSPTVYHLMLSHQDDFSFTCNVLCLPVWQVHLSRACAGDYPASGRPASCSNVTEISCFLVCILTVYCACLCYGNYHFTLNLYSLEDYELEGRTTISLSFSPWDFAQALTIIITAKMMVTNTGWVWGGGWAIS
jgi:hypothetical protein